MVNAPVLLLAATLRFFGSAGAESQLTRANESSPLNPHNVAGVPLQTNAGDVTAFGEASTDRWKLHVKVRADASDRAPDRIRGSEGYLQLHATSWLDVTAGRVIDKWGTGYGWTPTAFVGPSRDPIDPNDRRSAYRGADMVRADVAVMNTNVSLYALSGGARAVRVYRLVQGTDVSLVYRSGGAYGVNVSRVFGDALEVHAEVARIRHITRAVVGGQYTFPHDVNAVVELYYGGDGLTSTEWEQFRDDAPSDLRRANGAFAPLRMARGYAFVRLSHSFGPRAVDAELIAIANLRDGSSIARATISRKLRPNLSAYLIHTEFLGDAGSELAYVQISRATTAGVRVYF